MVLRRSLILPGLCYSSARCSLLDSYGRAGTMNTGPEEPTKARLGEVGVRCENEHAPLVLVHLPTSC